MADNGGDTAAGSGTSMVSTGAIGLELARMLGKAARWASLQGDALTSGLTGVRERKATPTTELVKRLATKIVAHGDEAAQTLPEDPEFWSLVDQLHARSAAARRRIEAKGRSRKSASRVRREADAAPSAAGGGEAVDAVVGEAKEGAAKKVPAVEAGQEKVTEADASAAVPSEAEPEAPATQTALEAQDAEASADKAQGDETKPREDADG